MVVSVKVSFTEAAMFYAIHILYPESDDQQPERYPLPKLLRTRAVSDQRISLILWIDEAINTDFERDR